MAILNHDMADDLIQDIADDPGKLADANLSDVVDAVIVLRNKIQDAQDRLEPVDLELISNAEKLGAAIENRIKSLTDDDSGELSYLLKGSRELSGLLTRVTRPGP